MLNNLLDILILFAGIWILNKYLRAILPLPNPEDAQNPQMIKGDFYRSLFVKLVKIRPESELELFIIARKEMGFGYSDKVVEQHYEKYQKTRDLPNYVEAFVEKGKDYILKA